MFFKGNKEIEEAYLGNKPISEIYLGSKLIFSGYKRFLKIFATIKQCVSSAKIKVTDSLKLSINSQIHSMVQSTASMITWLGRAMQITAILNKANSVCNAKVCASKPFNAALNLKSIVHSMSAKSARGITTYKSLSQLSKATSNADGNVSANIIKPTVISNFTSPNSECGTIVHFANTVSENILVIKQVYSAIQNGKKLEVV